MMKYADPDFAYLIDHEDAYSVFLRYFFPLDKIRMKSDNKDKLLENDDLYFPIL